jgi:hypothetical protein
MKEFLLLFRGDFNAAPDTQSEEGKAITKKWMDWAGSIAAQNKLDSRGNRLKRTGKVVRGTGIVTDGPYSEIKETLGGYTLVRSINIEEALELAKGCPVLLVGGNVEIREIEPL